VLACIAFKQPISQAEIDRLFDADKRGLVVKMRDLKLVEEFAGSDGRLRFATTEAFLQRFGLASLGELTSVQFLGSPPSTHPLIWNDSLGKAIVCLRSGGTALGTEKQNVRMSHQ
jgi:hypothetical protein